MIKIRETLGMQYCLRNLLLRQQKQKIEKLLIPSKLFHKIFPEILSNFPNRDVFVIRKIL
jgi:hypothetical protein